MGPIKTRKSRIKYHQAVGGPNGALIPATKHSFVLIIGVSNLIINIFFSFHHNFNGIDLPRSSCNMPCAGDPLENCGGSKELRLFSITGLPYFVNGTFIRFLKTPLDNF